MANKRFIYRNISSCEQLGDCSVLARLLFTWGLVHSNDWGVLLAAPRRLKAQIFAVSDESSEEVAAATEELVKAGLWVRFERDGTPYIYYPTFDKYQEIRWRSPNSRDGLPLPPNAVVTPKVTGNRSESPGVTENSRRGEERRGEEIRGDEHILSEVAGNGPGDPDAPPDLKALKEQKKQRDAQRMAAQTARLEEVLSSLPDKDRRILDYMIAGQQSEKRKGRPLTTLQHLGQAEIYLQQLEKAGAECWHDCCEISCRRDVWTVEFARGCVKNWKSESERPRAAEREPINPDTIGVDLSDHSVRPAALQADGTYVYLPEGSPMPPTDYVEGADTDGL